MNLLDILITIVSVILRIFGRSTKIETAIENKISEIIDSIPINDRRYHERRIQSDRRLGQISFPYKLERRKPIRYSTIGDLLDKVDNGPFEDVQ